MSAGIAVSLFTEALRVVNRALVEHKHSVFCQQLVRAGEKQLASREFGVALYDETDPSTPFDQFTVRFREGSFEVVSRATQAPYFTWRVPRSYLERIVDDPEAWASTALSSSQAMGVATGAPGSGRTE